MKNIVKIDRFISVALAAVLIFMLFIVGTSTTMAEPDYEMLGNEFVSYEQTEAGETGSGDAESGDSGSGEAGPGETGSGEGSSEDAGSNENLPADVNEGTGESEDAGSEEVGSGEAGSGETENSGDRGQGSGETEDSGDRNQGSRDEGYEDSGSEETEPEDKDEEIDDSYEESNSSGEDTDKNTEEETDNNTEKENDNNTEEETDEETDSENEESAAVPEIEGTGSISGFFWIDGNGDLETDWDGLYNGVEQPLVGFTVYLYAADDLSSAIAETKTNFGGNYSFNNLAPGSYALGLWGANVDGTEYLAPVFVTSDNKFEIDWSISGLPAYTEVIELEEGQAVAGINAGMRLPMGIAPYASYDSVRNLPDMKVNDDIKIDGRTWVAVRTATVQTDSGPIKAVYLLMRGAQYSSQNFGDGRDYATSALRDRMTKFYSETGSTGIPTIRSMALIPDLGNLSSKWSTTEPTKYMAGNQTEDIMFAPSYGDMYYWVGGEKNIGSGHPLYGGAPKPFAIRFWFRSPSDMDTAHMIGYFKDFNGFDYGLSVNGQSGISDIPGVWVNANMVPEDRYVTIHYIDTSGNVLHEPYTDPQRLKYDQAYPQLYHKVIIENISGYEYIEWRKGPDGAPQSTSVGPNLTAKEAGEGLDLFIVYRKLLTDITVTKSVTGNFSNRQKAFTFTVFLADSGGNPLAAGTTYNLVGGTISGTGATLPQDGKLELKAGGYDTFELRHGQTFTIMDLPRTAKIKIVETPVGGYSMVYTDSKYPLNTFEKNMESYETVGMDARRFDYLNTRDYTVPTGINDEIWAVAALAVTATVLLISGMAAVRHIKKKLGIRN